MDGLGNIDWRAAAREALVDLARGGMRSLAPSPFGGALGALSAPVAGFVFDQFIGPRRQQPASPATLTSNFDTPSELRGREGGLLTNAGTHRTAAAAERPGVNPGVMMAFQALQQLNAPQQDTLLQDLMSRGVASAVAPTQMPSFVLPQTRPLVSFLG
ncbi:MAG TPA: hypothetical protein VF223_13005 [Trebonia sp.]